MYLDIVVSGWRQSATHYPSIKVEGRDLTAYGRLDEDDLTLSDGTAPKTLHVEFSIFETSRMRDELSKLKDGEIGVFVYTPFMEAGVSNPALDAFIHGWLCLNAQLHQDVWDQVLMGGYSTCVISLGVGPVEEQNFRGWRWDVAKNAMLFITSADVRFKRDLQKAVEALPEKKRSSFWGS
jgi:hypothetical protein